MKDNRQTRMENDLGRDDIRKLVRRIALPSMLAQFVSVLYSIVDRMYIGHIPEVGELALAGVGVCGPVVTMIGSVASLVGMGGAPLMSIKMGEGDEAGARKILSNCFVLLCLFALALMAAVIPLRRPMLLFFGASASTLPYADAYFLYYMTGTVFALLSTGMNSFVTAQGYARKAMFSVLLGAVMNIVLDPVFIFALDMGVRGAAIATVISQACSCAYALRFLLGRRAQIRIERPRLESAIIRRVLTLGFTPFSIIAVDNAMIIAMNAVLQRYGGAGEGDLADHRGHHRSELHARSDDAAGRHQRRHAAHPQFQLRRAKGRSRDARAEAHLSLVPGVCGDHVWRGMAGGRAVRPPVHVGRAGAGKGRLGDPRLYAGADSPGVAI